MLRTTPHRSWRPLRFAGAEVPYFTGDPASSVTGGPQAVDPRAMESRYPVTGEVGRYETAPADPDADFVQVRECPMPQQLGTHVCVQQHKPPSTMGTRAGASPAGKLFRNVMTVDERARLMDTIGHWLGMAREDIRERTITLLGKIDAEYASGVRSRIDDFLAQ